MVVDLYHGRVKCMNTILYFGCIKDCGHYLFHPQKGKLHYKQENLIPWGSNIDGGIFGTSKLKNDLGLIHTQTKDGWTAISFADRSVDSRYGSHSTFVVQGEVTVADLLAGAKEQWPQVFGRPGFPTVEDNKYIVT